MSATGHADQTQPDVNPVAADAKTAALAPVSAPATTPSSSVWTAAERQNRAAQELAGETRWQLRADEKQPALVYRLDSNSTLRLRASRNGARVIFGWQF